MFVCDHDGQQLACVYFGDEPGRRSAAAEAGAAAQSKWWPVEAAPKLLLVAMVARMVGVVAMVVVAMMVAVAVGVAVAVAIRRVAVTGVHRGGRLGRCGNR